EKTGSLVVRRVLDGYNATVMAYGQTGSGKTFTLGNPLVHLFRYASLKKATPRRHHLKISI
ncbi:MAG: hypothetical protein AAF267_24425, partial [Deinococcota bacterium]